MRSQRNVIKVFLNVFRGTSKHLCPFFQSSIQTREKGRLGYSIDKKTLGLKFSQYKADIFDMIQNAYKENDKWTKQQFTTVY